jgi:hypothetical protein
LLTTGIDARSFFKRHTKSKMMLRRGMVNVWLTLIFSGIGVLFYYTEWKYLQPTPVPANYKPVLPGHVIKLAAFTTGNSGQPAKIAIVDLLDSRSLFVFDPLALRDYGCCLPNGNREPI